MPKSLFSFITNEFSTQIGQACKASLAYEFFPDFADLLVRFLHVGAIGTLSTVVRLDGERVLLLQLTVHLVFGPDDSLPSGLVQDHCLEGDILSVDPEATNLT